MRPIGADKLSEIITDTVKHIIPESEFTKGYVEALKASVKLIDEQPTIEQPTWISVDDRLPNPHEDVLVYDATAEAVTCGCLGLLGNWFNVPMKNEVTHWMPLPQPPKGVE